MAWQLDEAVKDFEMQNSLVPLQPHVGKGCTRSLFSSVKKEYKAKFCKKSWCH